MVAFMLVYPTAGAAAQHALPSDSIAPLQVEPRWAVQRYVSNRATLEFELSRPLLRGERLALMVGPTDVSGALVIRGSRAHYAPGRLQLPAGEGDVTAYVVTADGRWELVGQATLRVRGRSGFEQGTLSPSVDLATTGQLDQFVPDGTPPPDRRTYQDVTLRLALAARGVRDGWTIGLQSNAVGVSAKEQRLRYGERQDDAPALDLADYQLQVQRGAAHMAAGNQSVGSNRYLLSAFGSRGMSAGVQLHRGIAIEAAAVNGTNVVGWDNWLGVSNANHRLLSTGVTLELVPSRPGAFRVDLQGLDGSILPRTGFTQGAVTDAEKSRGAGVQFALSDAAQRVKLDAGVTQSRFRNPFDPLLAGDTTIVATRAERRIARFGELQLQLLQNASIGGRLHSTLGATLRHERVDPLYRSVGAFVQGDQQVNGGELTGTIGSLAVRGAYSRSRDNLADVPSILTTRTTLRSMSLAAPVAALVGAAARWWLPTASAAWEATVQAGVAIPENAEFQPSHVPDQYNRNRNASLAWSASGASLTYRWNESLQDNRQPGREAADLRVRVHTVQLGWTGAPRFAPALEGSIERQQLFESGLQMRTSRLGTLWQAQVTQALSFNGNVSHTWSWDPFAVRHTRNLELQGELSQGFTLYRATAGGTQGRVFVRYVRTRAVFRSRVPDAALVPQLMWTINAGSSFRFF